MGHGLQPNLYDPEYSRIILGSVFSPGVVKLKGHNRFKNWDVKAAKGQAGATSTLGGDPVGRFEAEFFLAGDSRVDGDPTDFDDWEDFQKLIESMTNGPRPVSLPIYHPDLARNGFTEVSSGGVGGMIHDGRGGALITVKFLEYKPPKPKVSAKAVAKPAVRQGTTVLVKPDPNAKAKAELEALLDQARQP
jgi:hypothetical protein